MLNYTLALWIDLDQYTFGGECTMRGSAALRLPVTLDSVGLDILDAHSPRHGRLMATTTAKHVVITAAKKGNDIRTLTIRFQGKNPISHKSLRGLYAVVEDGCNGCNGCNGSSPIFTTQFEPRDARRMFPCWDDPCKKATFDLSVTILPTHRAHQQPTTVVSNMPIKHIASNTYTFHRTPPMSTYLLHVTVGTFWAVQRVGPRSKVPLRVLANTPAKAAAGEFALQVADIFLERLGRYFGVPYFLPKLDLLAIPDFAAGAMENWGAITFRESALLFHPDQSSAFDARHVAQVIVHELVHQWFGNLVTLKTWSDLWLNESFATYLATREVADNIPSWFVQETFMNDVHNRVMTLDALPAAHAIVPRRSLSIKPKELFNGISYTKGAFVLQMLENRVGPCAFRCRLQQYIQTHWLSNASTAQFWKAMRPPASLKRMVRVPGYALHSLQQKSNKHKLPRFFALRPIRSSSSRVGGGVMVTAHQIIQAVERRSVGYFRLDLSRIVGRLLLHRVVRHFEIHNKTKCVCAIEADLYALTRQGSVPVRAYLRAAARHFAFSKMLQARVSAWSHLASVFAWHPARDVRREIVWLATQLFHTQTQTQTQTQSQSPAYLQTTARHLGVLRVFKTCLFILCCVDYGPALAFAIRHNKHKFDHNFDNNFMFERSLALVRMGERDTVLRKAISSIYQQDQHVRALGFALGFAENITTAASFARIIAQLPKKQHVVTLLRGATGSLFGARALGAHLGRVMDCVEKALGVGTSLARGACWPLAVAACAAKKKAEFKRRMRPHDLGQTTLKLALGVANILTRWQ